jgi:hypothetical protein
METVIASSTRATESPQVLGDPLAAAATST